MRNTHTNGIRRKKLRVVTFNYLPSAYQFVTDWIHENGHEHVLAVTSPGIKTRATPAYKDVLPSAEKVAGCQFTMNFNGLEVVDIVPGAGMTTENFGIFTSATLGTSDRNKLDVAFRFNNGVTSTIAGLGFEVYQNAPNPWINKTVIGFHLPEAAEAMLTVTDATGRTIYTQKGNFAKGYNSFSLDRSLGGFTLSAAEMFYKVETATDSGVKQMIQVR